MFIYRIRKSAPKIRKSVPRIRTVLLGVERCATSYRIRAWFLAVKLGYGLDRIVFYICNI